jgi:hypothetical protein
MQKVVGSSPIIRSKKSCKGACLVVGAENTFCRMARLGPEVDRGQRDAEPATSGVKGRVEGDAGPTTSR